MKIAVLGTGMQGRAALYHLEKEPDVERVLAVDCDLAPLLPFLQQIGARKVQPVRADAGVLPSLAPVLREVDAVISLLPVHLHAGVTRLALEQGAHVVTSSYLQPEQAALGEEAARRGLAILPECGLDPGIDLVLSAQAVRELDEVQEYYSYGSGVPDPAAAGNPLRYKVSWTFAGVLKAYLRDSRVVRAGRVVEIPGEEIFAPPNCHTVEMGEWGLMDAYPNGDVTRYLDKMGIRATVRNAGRYATRWPGHNALWYPLAQLGFLSGQELAVGGARVSPRDFLAALLEPQLQYRDDERDLALLRVEARGLRAGRRRRVVYQLSDARDLQTGLLAMNRTVGFAASIGALMLLRGQIAARGVLSPLDDIPFEPFLAELQRRGIQVTRSEDDWD